MTTAVHRVAIAGAGLLGRLLAWQLAGAGCEVSVFDPAPGPGERGAAGWTAAGMLSPWAELECADLQVARLGQRSLDLWPQLLAGLPSPVDFQRRGSLLLAHAADLGAARRLLGVLASKVPGEATPQSLTPAALRQLEPCLHGAAHAWLLEPEGQIHPVQAMQALAEGATLRGVRWHWQRPVQTLSPRRLRCGDAEFGFDWVFDVRGVGARPEMPVRGVRGEIVWLHAPGVALGRPVRLLHPRWRVYLVPRPGDVIVVGATEIESEDRSPVSVRSLLGLLSAAHSVLPELAEARLVHTEVNLRPALADNLPRIESCEGLTRINGLFRHGWLIAPALVEQALQDLALPLRRADVMETMR
ncbi:FAD-dependent oxidoreductase [Caldimonas brevitalea]|uniref:Thiamine biosynthesis protein thio n=1 Tax=Caldimonas brevitalea TaxID=413882 RepID=A0A0G3BQC8_9BURK|nr:FAD-dependent oxidoreductase [Caldimonas brevitalea]AKJ29561.1 thiamine biosynthesis protein thio [Caldimonas brevitalea]